MVRRVQGGEVHLTPLPVGQLEFATKQGKKILLLKVSQWTYTHLWMGEASKKHLKQGGLYYRVRLKHGGYLTGWKKLEVEEYGDKIRITNGEGTPFEELYNHSGDWSQVHDLKRELRFVPAIPWGPIRSTFFFTLAVVGALYIGTFIAFRGDKALAVDDSTVLIREFRREITSERVRISAHESTLFFIEERLGTFPELEALALQRLQAQQDLQARGLARDESVVSAQQVLFVYTRERLALIQEAAGLREEQAAFQELEGELQAEQEKLQEVNKWTYRQWLQQWWVLSWVKSQWTTIWAWVQTIWQ